MAPEFTVMVTGSRTWADRDELARQLETVRQKLLEEHELETASFKLVHGGARGADFLAAQRAHALNWPVQSFALTNEDWRRDGRRAGVLRNERMLQETRPHAVLALRWDGASRGTDDAVKRANSMLAKFSTQRLLQEEPENRLSLVHVVRRRASGVYETCTTFGAPAKKRVFQEEDEVVKRIKR